MNANQFRTARAQLGLSARLMARALGLSDGRTIRAYESGQCKIGGPVAMLMRYILRFGVQKDL